jgi:hypothetical protein
VIRAGHVIILARAGPRHQLHLHVHLHGLIGLSASHHCRYVRIAAWQQQFWLVGAAVGDSAVRAGRGGRVSGSQFVQVHVHPTLASASIVRHAEGVQGNSSSTTGTPSDAGTGARRASEADSSLRLVSGLRALFRRGHHRLGDDPRRQWCMTGHA